MPSRHGFWTIAAAMLVVGAGVVATVGRRPSVPTARVSPGTATRQALFAEIQPVNVANCQLERFGEANDGGYILCGNLLDAVKAGYSYGISGYDGWGCDISRRLRIPVHQYDCFDLREPQCPDGNTVFHGECVGTGRSVQEGRPFDTLAAQFDANGDRAGPLVMKIDVEGAEWDAFLLAPDSVFERLDQLEVEFHHVEEERYVAAMQRLKTFFEIAHVHFNNFSCDPALAPFPSWAFEVLFVNKRIARTDHSPAPANLAPQDAPNDPQAADCQAAPTTTRTL